MQSRYAHLDALENQSIYILREAYRKFKRSAMLWSIGKDSTVLLWLATGPYFGYSDTWLLAMNTWTNIVTFLMVFLIQNAQNRHSAALQAKLDELIRVGEAHNSFVGIKQLSHEEIGKVREEAHGQLGARSA